MDHLLKPENFAMLEAARVVYCTGFFITVSPESIMAVANHCAAADKIFSMASGGRVGWCGAGHGEWGRGGAGRVCLLCAAAHEFTC